MKRKMRLLDNQFCRFGDQRWRVSRLTKLVEDFEIFTIPLKHIVTYDIYPKSENTKEYIEHIRRVLSADLERPIILDEEGCLMDGRHRLLKAMMNGKTFILAVRFDENPEPCEIVKESDND